MRVALVGYCCVAASWCQAVATAAEVALLTPHDTGTAFLETTTTTMTTDPQGPVGWRMVDRFCAFRFEATLPQPSEHDDVSAMDTAEAFAIYARSLRCFGWIQHLATPRRVVGEARCPTRTAHALEAHLRELHGLSAPTVRRYANTKIRYHFPSFRVLSEAKYGGKTCFSSPPHACYQQPPDDDQ